VFDVFVWLETRSVVAIWGKDGNVRLSKCTKATLR